MDTSSRSSPTPAPRQSQQHRRREHQHHTAIKRTRLSVPPIPDAATKMRQTEATIAAPPVEADRTAVTASPWSMDALPPPVLREIGDFAMCTGSALSGVSKATLKAVREVHLKIDTLEKYRALVYDGFSEDGVYEKGTKPLSVDPAGALPSGRVVTHISFPRGFSCVDFNEIFEKFMRGTIPSLRSIHISTEDRTEPFVNFMRGTIPSLRSIRLSTEDRTCPVLDALIPRSSKRYVVAPNLTRVVLKWEGTHVHKAGKAINAGLWPALEELDLRDCRANAGHFENLARAIMSGRLPNLRLLNWDKQSEVRDTPLDDVVLSALASGRCPLVESLSFTGNRYCPEYHIDRLGDALRACPNLRVLKMDCSRSPGRELRTLTSALEAGHVPHLCWVVLRATKAYDAKDRTREGVEALRRAAGQRTHHIELDIDVKTCRPKY